MLHASFVRSPFARAVIRGIDTSAARALPGVRAVFTAADLNPDAKEQWHTSVGRASPETPRPPLADGEVRFVGDPVALVVAESLYVAEDATELVDVDYEPRPAIVDYTTAEGAEALVHEQHGSNVIGELAGLPAAALDGEFASAAHVVSETIFQQRYAAVPMEGRGLIVDGSGPTGELTIYSATQSPHEVRLFCSRLLGIPEHRIRVIMRDTGGGFGQKIMVQRDEMCLMLAAPKLGAAVKWVEDRRDNLLAAGASRHEHADVAMAFDGDGAIQAARIDFVSDCGAYPTPWPVSTAAVVGVLFPGPYRVPRASFTSKSIYTNTVGRAAYRGPWQFESLAREVLLDIAARQMGMDPVELRRRNLLRRDELPYANPNGMTYSNVSPGETFEQALAMLDYDAFRAEQAEQPRARPLPRGGRFELRRAVDPGVRCLRNRGCDHPHRAVGHGQRVRRRRLDRQQHRDDGRPAHRRRARRRHRRRRDHPGRHCRHRIRCRCRREPQRIDDRRRGARHRVDPARAHRCHRRAQAGSGGRRHRTREQPGERAGYPVGRHHLRRSRRPRVLRAPGVAARRARGAGGERPVHHQRIDLGERHPRVHLRGRRRSPVRCSCCATSSAKTADR